MLKKDYENFDRRMFEIRSYVPTKAIEVLKKYIYVWKQC